MVGTQGVIWFLIGRALSTRPNVFLAPSGNTDLHPSGIGDWAAAAKLTPLLYLAGLATLTVGSFACLHATVYSYYA